MERATLFVTRTLLLAACVACAACGRYVPDSACPQRGPASASASLKVGRAELTRLLPSPIEGDVLPTPSRAGLRGGSVSTSRAEALWPGGVIPYEIYSGLPNPGRVVDAIAHWNARLGGVIQLIPRSHEFDYVLFLPGSALCQSQIGRAKDAQPVYLGPGCATQHVIHEIGHVVGLWHEHSRNDRDGFVKIHWENMNPAYAYAFAMPGSEANDIGEYDFGSIMHYSAFAFSMNGQPTIETIPPGVSIGQSLQLSQGDVQGALMLYGVDPKTAAAMASGGCP